MRITKFIWLMQKKTTVGIHRFEDLIHKEFQELVEMGCARLTTFPLPLPYPLPHSHTYTLTHSSFCPHLVRRG